MSPSPVVVRRAALIVPCCFALILGGATAHRQSAVGQHQAAEAPRAAPAAIYESVTLPRTPIDTGPAGPTAPVPTHAAHRRAAADPLFQAERSPAPRSHSPISHTSTPTKHTSTNHATTQRTSTRHANTTGATRTATTASGTSSSQIAYAVLNLLNSERGKHNVPALRMNSRLISSAHAHNLSMAAQNTMSHQLPGEASFSTRISRAGYGWRAVGEDIGWNSVMTTSGALYLERLMYNEGPGGGHYENIVSATYRDVGIDIYLDRTHHKLWLTEDFGLAG